jgi:hypothetical protein
MAIISCPECKSLVSDQAENCIKSLSVFILGS